MRDYKYDSETAHDWAYLLHIMQNYHVEMMIFFSFVCCFFYEEILT